MKFKSLHHNFILPKRASTEAGGFDIHMPVSGEINPGYITKVPLGFATQVPHGFGAILMPRSGAGSRGLTLVNTIGLIDADYRGEWVANLTIHDGPYVKFESGDRLLQFFVVPLYSGETELVVDLNETDRGVGGFGSTGV